MGGRFLMRCIVSWSRSLLIISSLFLSLTALTPSTIANVPLMECVGISAKLKTEYRYLSPLSGMSFITRLENYYKYSYNEEDGNSNGNSNENAQDNHAVLIRELFHQVDQVNILPTSLGSRAPTHITPRLMGKIVARLHLLTRNDYREAKKLMSNKKERAEWVKSIVNMIEQDSAYRESISKSEGKVKELEAKLTAENLKEISSRDIQKINKLEREIKITNPLHKFLEKSIKKIIKSSLGAIEEEASRQPNMRMNGATLYYAPHTVFRILTAWVWRISGGVADLNNYYQGLNDVLNGEESESL
ncbi:MAG: hypothetical protein HQK53_17565, partial [Oligoflexia bacterium]|nr:hypothetical protein [Oligoflexia bacterium]